MEATPQDTNAVEITIEDTNPQVEVVPVQAQTTELSTDNPQQVIEVPAPATEAAPSVGVEEQKQESSAPVVQNPTNYVQPESVKEEETKGRPCEFCKDKEAILQKTGEYINTGKSDKPKILFLNELAVVILEKHRETIMNWAYKKTDDGSLEHAEFFDMIKTIEEIQELRLQQRLLGRYNPTGSIFLLKTKHGYIETDKKILTGDTKEPLQIIITEAPNPNDTQ